MIGLRAALVLGLVSGAGGFATQCTPRRPPPVVATPPAPVKAGPEITVTTTPVPLDPADPAKVVVGGGFTYAGGLALTSADTSRLHGLSDLSVTTDGRLTAISDEGDVFEAQLRLDAGGKLVGLSGGKLRPLPGLDGQPLPGKQKADAEGLAVLPNGERLVSFEGDHRIWRYAVTPDGTWSRPAPAPKPSTIFPDNEGMEAIAAYPAAGPDAYIVGGEEGEVWLCRLSSECRSLPPQSGPDFTWGLTAFAPFAGTAVATLHRGYDPIRGWRAVVRFISDPTLPPARQRTIAALHIDGAMPRDNFEGLALAGPPPGAPPGATRLYLISDDGAVGKNQRTLLLAFDWVAPPAPPPLPPKPAKKPVRRR
ncbi:esterase-like activity of phytase family protein [Caulobacter segnis]|uniref:esterase-like activity of phytase family protein n=1 Tax=Caulobacter segnis TaxID=88688 RepID=UPI001CBC95F5|nr:esterase-like activity of phytase family protein [Caulobacter segnis]UAL10018.1 esterase-like activity of phytase family protein [Caulobacter segnis]